MLNELVSDLGPAFDIPDTGQRRKTYVNPWKAAEEKEAEEQDGYAMVNTCASHTIDYYDIQEPCSYSETVKSPQASEWKKAMLAELDAMLKQNVLEEIAVIPDTGKATGSHWVFKVKRDSHGKITRYKARCGQGRSAAGRHRLRRNLCSHCMYWSHPPCLSIGCVAAKHDWEIEQMDVCTAFLGSLLHEDTYMRPPPGYTQLLQLQAAGAPYSPVRTTVHYNSWTGQK